MTILNLQTLTPKTPEEELLEGVPGLNISPLPSGIDLTPPPPDVPRFRGYGDFLAQRGGFAPEDLRTREELMGMTQAEVDEYQRQRRQARRAGIGETLLRVGQAFQGKDATALAMQREQNRRLIEQQEELKKAQEGFFKDPKYKDMAKIYGMEFAFEQRQADVQAEAQAQANQNLNVAIDKSDLPQSQKDLLKSLSPNLKAQALMKSFEPKSITPSDYKAEILGKIQRGEALTPEDQRVLDILQRTDPIDIAIRQYAGQPITETPTGTQEKQIKTYASKEEAINAGLKSGDQFYGTDGALYQIP